MKTRITTKLIITGVVLLSAIALLAIGTFAWFTLYNKVDAGGVGIRMEKSDRQWPFEIIQADDSWTLLQQVKDAPGWDKNLTLHKVKIDGDPDPKEIGDCYQLRPISTYDGENWFLADYNASGGVEGVEKTELKAVGNVNRYDPYPQEEGKDVPANYVYYYDVWIRVRGGDKAENDYTLHLNNPLSMDNLLDDEVFFGTYVLPGIIRDMNGNLKESEAGYDASTCLRIGFQFFKQMDDTYINTPDFSKTDYEKPDGFWIYEPNCDKRAKSFEKYKGSGLINNSYEAQKGITYVAGADEDHQIKVGQHKDLGDDTELITLLPKLNNSGEVEYAVQPNTIQQKQSKWDETKIQEKTSPSDVTSRDIAVLGEFISHNDPPREGYDGIDTPPMRTIYRDQPQHVRIFIWMEGQDADCWNSSLTGSLAINLEFRGEAVDNGE